MSVNKINEAIKPYYTLLTTIIGIGGIIIGAYAFLLKPSSLSVVVSKEKIDYPSSINDDFLGLFSYLLDSCSNTESKLQAKSLYDYLIETEDHWSIKLINESNKYIKGLEIRIPNTKKLTSFGVSSNFLLDEEKDNLLNKVEFQEKSNIIYIKPEVEIPSNSNIEILLWGDLPDYGWNDDVLVRYDGGNGNFRKEVKSVGFEAYVAEFYIEIFLVLLILFILTYTIGIKAYETNSKKTSSEPN